MNKTPPTVSVILTSFNHDKYLRETIESVLNQVFKNFELIIWDDGSVDSSWEIINSYDDPRIRAFRNSGNEGPIFGMNKSIHEIARGKYIAIHHSDDVWDLDKLKNQVIVLEEHSEVGAVFTNALAISENSSPLNDEEHFYLNVFNQPNRTRHEWLRFFLIHGNALCHPSLLIRKACYENCGLYNHNFTQLPDFDMWIRLCLKYEIHVLPEKLIKFRVRDNEANSSGSRPDTRIRSTYEFYKLLTTYRELTRFDDLVKVFPEAEKYYRGEETDMDFVLAMAMLDLKSFPFTQLFAQDLLFDIISEPKRAANIMRLYDFGYKNFISITGNNDVFSVEKTHQLHHQIHQIHSSLFWKISWPLRSLLRLLRQFK